MLKPDLPSGRCDQEERYCDASNSRADRRVESSSRHPARDKPFASSPPGDHRNKQGERLCRQEQPFNEVARHTETETWRLSKNAMRSAQPGSVAEIQVLPESMTRLLEQSAHFEGRIGKIQDIESVFDV
jgi:hypothetical protein